MALKDKIITDIKKQHISPRPRWQYVSLHAMLIIFGILTLLAGSFAYSFMLLHFSLPERAYFDWLVEQDRPRLILMLPYLWLIGVILALVVGYVVFSKTGRVYRYHASILASILILGSMIGGLLLYVSRIADWSDEQLQHFGPPMYGQMRQELLRRLPQPEEGTLPLQIIRVKGGVYIGRAPDREQWEVHLNCVDDACREKIITIRPKMPVIFE